MRYAARSGPYGSIRRAAPSVPDAYALILGEGGQVSVLREIFNVARDVTDSLPFQSHNYRVVSETMVETVLSSEITRSQHEEVKVAHENGEFFFFRFFLYRLDHTHISSHPHLSFVLVIF